MLGAMEKGVEAARVGVPPKGCVDGVDLRTLPKYISFKAAVLKERVTLHRLLVALGVAFAVYVTCTRVEIYRLYEALRQKEYILAPGVLDLTPASPGTVPDSYVEHAVIDFLSELGNVNATNIDEQFSALTAFMNPALKVRFEAEAADWRTRVKADGLTEALTILGRRIETDGRGRYQVTADVRTDTYVKSEYLGGRAEVVEMELTLVPPRDGKRWFLEITELSRTSADGFKARESLIKGGNRE